MSGFSDWVYVFSSFSVSTQTLTECEKRFCVVTELPTNFSGGQCERKEPLPSSGGRADIKPDAPLKLGSHVPLIMRQSLRRQTL